MPNLPGEPKCRNCSHYHKRYNYDINAYYKGYGKAD